MTSEQFSLLPARSDNDAALLGRFELAAGGVPELGEGIGTEVGQRMALEPGPEVLDRIELWRIPGQEMKLNAPCGGGHVVAHQVAAMGSQAVPEDEQRPAKVSEERFEELDDLFFGDGSFMQPKAHPGEVHAGDERQLMPVEVKLHHWRLAFQRPGAHPSGTLRDAGFVDEYDQSSLAAGVFFSAGQVRLRQCSMAAGLRSRARRSGFWLEKPSCPSRRQT